MAASEEIKNWYALRIKAIHERATVHDLLRRHGVKFKHTGDREEQFSCPFHGKDESPSARVYPAGGRSPSHAWCFVCKERWDVISLWKKYAGSETKSFHAVLREIEKFYGIQTPEMPQEGTFEVPLDERVKADFDRRFEECEQRLLSVREDYERNDDMKGYLLAGSILDKTYYQVSEGKLSFREGTELLKKLVQKIGERVRSGSFNQAADA